MKDNWNDQDFATDWDQTSAVQNPNRLALLDLLTAIVSDNYVEGKYILDLGCGSGRVEMQILEKLPSAKFVGIDASDVMLAKAKQRISNDNLIAVQHQLEDISSLALPVSNFQCAFTSFVLHEVAADSKKAVFQFIFDHLPKGGYYLLVDRFKIDVENLKLGYSSQWNRTIHPEWKGNVTFDEYEGKMETKEDSPDTLEDQIKWLREIGFKADCLQLQLDRGLVLAVK